MVRSLSPSLCHSHTMFSFLLVRLSVLTGRHRGRCFNIDPVRGDVSGPGALLFPDQSGPRSAQTDILFIWGIIRVYAPHTRVNQWFPMEKLPILYAWYAGNAFGVAVPLEQGTFYYSVFWE